VQGAYSYAIVEKVMGISTNRSNANLEGGLCDKEESCWCAARCSGSGRMADFASDLIPPGLVFRAKSTRRSS